MQSSDKFSPPNTPISAPISPEFTPMPLRARGVLEVLDLSIKVYRRYFATLMSWSGLVVGLCALVGLYGLVSARQSLTGLSDPQNFNDFATSGMASLMLSSFAASVLWFFCLPLIIGSATCCVAAAVRGQNVKFAQCWSFTRPRYWAMLGQTLLAAIMIGIGNIGIIIAFAAVGGIGAYVISALPTAVGGIIGVIGFVVLYVGYIVLILTLTLWMAMVPVIVCMEENHRSSATSRASVLFRGNWRRAAGLTLLISLGSFVALGILQMPLLIFGIGGASASMAIFGGTFLAQMFFMLLVLPFLALLVALFYLDVRVRNEALDLQWSAHAGTERNLANSANVASANIAAATQNFSPNNFQNANLSAQNANALTGAPIEYSNAPETATSQWNPPTTNLDSSPIAPPIFPDATPPQNPPAPDLSNAHTQNRVLETPPNIAANADFLTPKTNNENFVNAQNASSANDFVTSNNATPQSAGNAESPFQTPEFARPTFDTPTFAPENAMTTPPLNSPNTDSTTQISSPFESNSSDAIAQTRDATTFAQNALPNESSTRYSFDDANLAARDEISNDNSATNFAENSATFSESGAFSSNDSAAFAPVFAPTSPPISNVQNPDFSLESAHNVATQNAENATKCPQCGAEVPANQSFCMNCGARVAQRNDASNFSA